MTERRAVLAEYRATAAQVERALEPLSPSELEQREGPADWRIREIIHHLADVEVGDAMRLRQMVAHESPLIVAYDEGLFASRLHYDRPIANSRALYVTLRASSAEIVERLSDDDWLRSGQHEERDRFTVEILVRRGIEHDRLHLAQIQRALRSEADPD